MEINTTRISFIVRHLMGNTETDYEIKMELFDELVKLLINFKSYGLHPDTGFHNEELPVDWANYELISFPLKYEGYDMHFDYSPIINTLLESLENILVMKSYSIEENFNFYNDFSLRQPN